MNETLLKENKYYKAWDLGEGIVRIHGSGGELCFLVKGTEKALLIDTTAGYGSLKTFLSDLYSTPLIVVNTHGHLDHIGADFEFDEVYLHPADHDLFFEHSSAKGRAGFVAAANPSLEEMVPVREIRLLPLEDGKVFDLGNRCFRTVTAPGHTKGSCCLFDEESGDFFAGDACNSNTLLFLSDSTTVAEYYETMKKLKKLEPKIRRFYTFHGFSPVDPSAITDNLLCCEDILAGKDDHIEVEVLGRKGLLAKEREGMQRKDGRFSNIVYAPDKIR